MGTVITPESLRGVDTETLVRMWEDVGGVGEMLAECDMFPGMELMRLADMLFDEITDRGAALPHYPVIEDLIGVVEIEEDHGED